MPAPQNATTSTVESSHPAFPDSQAFKSRMQEIATQEFPLFSHDIRKKKPPFLGRMLEPYFKRKAEKFYEQALCDYPEYFLQPDGTVNEPNITFFRKKITQDVAMSVYRDGQEIAGYIGIASATGLAVGLAEHRIVSAVNKLFGGQKGESNIAKNTAVAVGLSTLVGSMLEAIRIPRKFNARLRGMLDGSLEVLEQGSHYIGPSGGVANASPLDSKELKHAVEQHIPAPSLSSSPEPTELAATGWANREKPPATDHRTGISKFSAAASINR